MIIIARNFISFISYLIAYFLISIVFLKVKFLKEEICIEVFPKDRDRYLKLFQIANKPLIKIRKLSPGLIKLISLISPTDFIISADYFELPNPRISEALKSLEYKVFIWNDEIEVLMVQKNLNVDNLECLGFFSATAKAFGTNVNFAIPEMNPQQSVMASATSPSICFAGQADPSKYDQQINSDKELTKISKLLISEVLEKSPMVLFTKYSPANLNLSISDFVMLRHKAVNTWRSEVLKQLAKEFGKSLTLIGKDFVDNPDYSLAKVFSDSNQFPKEYEKHKVNIELGSQCGAEYLYPRSIEIFAVNPGSLFVFDRGNSYPSLPGTFWKDTEDLIAKIHKQGINSSIS